ncbi:MAG: Na+/H+ antiporter subunit E [Aggregatilineales bacterium]
MNFFLLNVILAFAWAALNGALTIPNFTGGYVIGYVMLFISRDALGGSQYVMKVQQVVRFLLYFLWQLIQSNVRVASEVLTPGHNMTPAIIAVPLDLKSEIGILLLANVITLTPGTLSLDVSVDQNVLFVHTMYTTDAEAFRQEIKQGFEKRIRELFNESD